MTDDSDARKAEKITSHLFKKGQSGNPAGRGVVTQKQFNLLLKAIAKQETETQKLFWDHVVQRAYKNDSLLKQLVDKLLPRRHVVSPELPRGGLEQEYGRLQEMRERFYREVEEASGRRQTPLEHAPPPPDDEERSTVEAEVISSEDQGTPEDSGA